MYEISNEVFQISNSILLIRLKLESKEPRVAFFLNILMLAVICIAGQTVNKLVIRL